MKEVRTLIFEDHDPYHELKALPFIGHGWNSDVPVFETAINQTKPCKLIVEVGTWLGASARHMAEVLLAQGQTDFEIVCVDTYLGSVEHWTRQSAIMAYAHGHPTVYYHFISNTHHKNLQNYLTPFPCDSLNAYLTLKKWNVVPDMVYIDAGHDYESVSGDIRRWVDLLRPGGTLLLDDAHHEPIQRAVADNLYGATEKDIKFLWQKPL